MIAKLPVISLAVSCYDNSKTLMLVFLFTSTYSLLKCSHVCHSHKPERGLLFWLKPSFTYIGNLKQHFYEVIKYTAMFRHSHKLWLCSKKCLTGSLENSMDKCFLYCYTEVQAFEKTSNAKLIMPTEKNWWYINYYFIRYHHHLFY